MSVLVTGVAGFLASHVADALLAAGQDVVGLDDLSGGFRENVAAGVRFYEGSILDTDLLHRIFAEHRIELLMSQPGYVHRMTFEAPAEMRALGLRYILLGGQAWTEEFRGAGPESWCSNAFPLTGRCKGTICKC